MELNVLVLVSMDDPQRQTKRMVKNTVEESVNLVKYANTVGAQDVHLSDPEPHSPASSYDHDHHPDQSVREWGYALSHSD